ncbi:MAG: polysaccharide deacetylase family protein [Candidatus Fimadaptatus sp.]
MQDNGRRGTGDEYAGRMARRREAESAGENRNVMQAPRWEPDRRAETEALQDDAERFVPRRRYSRVDDGTAGGDYRRADERRYEGDYHRRADERSYDGDYRRRADERSYEGDYHRRADERSGYDRDIRRSADERSYEGDYRRSADERSGYDRDTRRRADERSYEGDYRRSTDERGYSGDTRRRTDERSYERAPRREYGRAGEAEAGDRSRYAPQRRRAGGTAPVFGNDERARGEEESPVYGGREHDNIDPADARPGVGRLPIIAMAAVALLLIVFVPMLINGRRNVADMQAAGQGAAGAGVQVTAQAPDPTDAMPGEATEAPTEAPTAEPTEEPLPSNLIVSRYTGRTLDKDKPAVALTFDDGPSGQTPRILDALEQNGGLATFFLVGDRVEKYAETAQREYQMGCLVGTHLYSHTKLTTLSAEEIKSELDLCNAAHESVLGAAPEVARPPYGSANATVKETLNMPLINWSLNSNDWETRDADRIYNDVMNNVQDGDIVLFHDLKDFSASAIERIAPALADMGYQMVTVQELFELKGRTLEPVTLYSKRVVVVDDSAG